MDLNWSEEEILVKNTAAQFVQRELLSVEGSFLKQKQPFLPPGDPPRRALDGAISGVLREKAKQAGLWALESTEGGAGGGLSHIARALIYREFGKTILPFEPLSIPVVLSKSRSAEQLLEGEMSIALAFGEIHKTGDLTGVRAGYRSLPDGYSLHCSGIEVLNPGSDLYLLPAREGNSGQVGLFLLDRDMAGLHIEEEMELSSDETAARMAISEGKVPRNRLIGYENDIGAIIAQEQLRIAARSLGIGVRCLESSLEHARNRVTFGRPLSSRQAVQWMLADLSISLRTSSWLTFEAAWQADQDLPYFQSAALAKKRAARMAFEAADTAIQIHGGYGVCKEFPFEGFYREARLMRLLYGREFEMDTAIGEAFLGLSNEK